MTAYPSAPVDAGQFTIDDALAEAETHAKQADVIALVDADRIHADDKARIRAAIIADGKAHAGRVDCNRVRVALTNNGGHLDVYPRTVGPTYDGMVRSGLLKTLGYIDVNEDQAGRNKGKPAMAYELTEAGWAA